MQHDPWTGTAPGAAWQQVVHHLPFPVFVADVRTPKWPVVVLNAAFEALVGPAQGVQGRPVDDVLSSRLSEPSHDDLDELLGTVVRTGEPLLGRRVEIAATDGDSAWSQCWLSLKPLLDADGACWGVLGTLIDDFGEGLGGPRRRRRDALRSMAGSLLEDRPIAERLHNAAAGAARTAGAQCAAVMFSDGSGEFRVAAEYGCTPMPPRFTVAETAEDLIDVAWGRTRLVWSADRPRHSAAAADALPFIGTPDWEHALVVGTRIRGGGFGLVAVGGPGEEGWDDGALERLDLAAVLIGAAVESDQLHTSFARIEELLRGAVTTSAGLAGLTEPAAVRRQIVEGIVEHMQLAGATLWLRDDETTGAVLVAAAGIPDHVRQAVASLPPTDAVSETASGGYRWRIPTEATAARAWEGRHFHVVPVPDPSPGALGIYADEPLPPAAHEIFATMAQALASAVEQTTLHRRARSVVEALQRQLQPGLIDLPADFEAGHIYRSATAGVPIGGDFLDVFTTADGHVGLACGDVSGKGIEAATLSAMAVYSLRAFALQGAGPRIVLSMMDGAVEAQTGDDRFATMIYGRVDPASWRADIAVAGHPPPILVTRDGARILDLPADVPVGMLGVSTYSQDTVDIPEDSSLVLYTDGVIEARAADESRALFGLDRLLEALDGMRGQDAQAIADGVWRHVQEWSKGQTTDDCAVIVLRRRPAT